MGKRNDPRWGTSAGWVFRRELEIQARPSARGRLGYRGLLRPLAYILMLALVMTHLRDHLSASGPALADEFRVLTVLLCPYALYRVHAAACLGANAMGDLVVLRHSGAAPADVLMGKLAAALLPLWLELALLAPVVGTVMYALGFPSSAGESILALLVLQTVCFGLVGMAMALSIPYAPGQAVPVRWLMGLLLYPVTCLLLVQPWPVKASMEAVTTLLGYVHPAFQVFALSTAVAPDDANWHAGLTLVSLPNGVVLLQLGLSLVLGALVLRRLSGRLR